MTGILGFFTSLLLDFLTGSLGFLTSWLLYFSPGSLGHQEVDHQGRRAEWQHRHQRLHRQDLQQGRVRFTDYFRFNSVKVQNCLAIWTCLWQGSSSRDHFTPKVLAKLWSSTGDLWYFILYFDAEEPTAFHLCVIFEAVIIGHLKVQPAMMANF